MSKDSGHLAGRGPGQAAVTHRARQAATLPLQAGSELTHSFARLTSRRTEASEGEGSAISASLNSNMTQVAFKTFFLNHSLASQLGLYSLGQPHVNRVI